MALMIKSDTLAGVNRLELRDDGISHKEGVLAATAQVLPYAGVDCVLLSPEGELSVQWGRKVAVVKLKLENEQHQDFLDQMLFRIRQAQGALGSGHL